MANLNNERKAELKVLAQAIYKVNPKCSKIDMDVALSFLSLIKKSEVSFIINEYNICKIKF